MAGDEREQRVVFALPDVLTRLMLRAALANQNRASIDQLASEALYAEPLLSLPLFISALIWMIIVGALGYRAMRATQMATQYSWAYDSSGLNWRAKGNG